MDILDRLATALERNNELLEQAAEGRERAIAAAEKATSKPAADKKATADKKAAEAEKPATEQKAATSTGDTPTVEDVNNAIVKYVGATNRPEERDARKAKVAGVLAKFSPEGTAKPNGGTLAEDKRGAFIKTVDKWIADGDLTQPAAEEEASEGDDLLG